MNNMMQGIFRIVIERMHKDMEQPTQLTMPDGAFLEDTRLAVSNAVTDLFNMTPNTPEEDIDEVICTLINEALELAYASGKIQDLGTIFKKWHYHEYDAYE